MGDDGGIGLAFGEAVDDAAVDVGAEEVDEETEGGADDEEGGDGGHQTDDAQVSEGVVVQSEETVEEAKGKDLDDQLVVVQRGLSESIGEQG